MHRIRSLFEGTALRLLCLRTIAVDPDTVPSTDIARLYLEAENAELGNQNDKIRLTLDLPHMTGNVHGVKHDPVACLRIIAKLPEERPLSGGFTGGGNARRNHP